jgi:hypothetical protein
VRIAAKLLLLPLWLTSHVACADMSATDAFNDGSAFGTDNVGAAKNNINTTTASGGVPNYTATDPASGYFMGGQGSLTPPAAASVTNCTSTPGTADPDPHTHGKCEGVRMLMNDPGKKNVMFPLSSATDPLVVKRNMVAGDAETYLGSLIVSGANSGCANKTVKDPDKYQTETCQQYLAAGEEACEEVLSVTVTTKFCTPGAVLYSYSTYKGDTIQLVCDANPSKLRVTGNFNGWCYPEYVPFQHLAVISVEATPKILAKGSISYYQTGGGCYSDDAGNTSCEPISINGPISSMHPELTPNNVLFGSYYRRGCMVELKPSACDLSAETCTFNLRLINQYNWDDSYYPDIVADLTTPPMKTPQYHAEEDFWDNQCSALEARLP